MQSKFPVKAFFSLIVRAYCLIGRDGKDIRGAHSSDMVGRKRIILKIFLGK